MPRESFYTPTVVEGERPPEARGDMFAVEWAPDGPYSVPGGNGDVTSVAIVAGVHLDASGVDRLIRVLRRARNKATPRREHGSVTSRCPACRIALVSISPDMPDTMTVVCPCGHGAPAQQWRGVL